MSGADVCNAMEKIFFALTTISERPLRFSSYQFRKKRWLLVLLLV
jgi:hypothetical protein